MASTESAGLITIGVLARASGLTASALRFYDDCGLLTPARVDPFSGYRYYTRAHIERATLIRRLRAIDLPLETVTEVLSGDIHRARRLLDEHAAELARRAREAARIVRELERSLPAAVHVTLEAPTLAQALRQVGAAAARTREIPVLAGILLEAEDNAVTLTATDRYRLSTRTVVPRRRHGEGWSAMLDADGLGQVEAWLREVDEVVVAPAEHALVLSADGAEHHIDLIDAPFPDHRAVLAGIGPVRTRVVLPRSRLAALLEHASSTVRLTIEPVGVTAAADGREDRLPATVTGFPVALSFDPATLLPAVRTALGPDLMLDVAAPDQPVMLRSATDGDLTTLAMPTRQATDRKAPP